MSTLFFVEFDPPCQSCNRPVPDAFLCKVVSRGNGKTAIIWEDSIESSREDWLVVLRRRDSTGFRPQITRGGNDLVSLEEFEAILENSPVEWDSFHTGEFC